MMRSHSPRAIRPPSMMVGRLTRDPRRSRVGRWNAPPVVDGGLKGRASRNARRAGVTLSEILVSLLVMSIGVVSVATLFPLSVFRTIQATQLTNAAQHRYNYEGLVGARPELATGAPLWQAGSSYQSGDLVVATAAGDRYFECSGAGTSGAQEPNWNFRVGGSTTDGGATWQTRRAAAYMIDPIGWQERLQELRDLGTAPNAASANVQNTFGRISLGPPPTVTTLDSPYRIVRFRGGRTGDAFNPASSTFYPAVGSAADRSAVIGALQTAVLPDTWTLQTDSTDVIYNSGTPTEIRLQNLSASIVQTLDQDSDNQVDTTTSGTERDVRIRVTLFNADGSRSLVRAVNGIDQPAAGIERLQWTASIPTGFTPVRARIETFEQRYSWMVTVRKETSGATYSSLVVFFRRSLDPADELIHPANLIVGNWPGSDGNQGTNDDVADLKFDTLGNPSVTLAAGADSSINTVDDIPVAPLILVQYSASLGSGTPFIRRGGYVLDAQNNRWYRITSYQEVSDINAVHQLLHGGSGAYSASPGAVLRLDNAILEGSGIYGADQNNPNTTPGVILMPGIIDVYPLEPQLPWE